MFKVTIKFMKRFLFLFICSFCFHILYAQQLSVQRFGWDEADMTASSENTKMVDQNGKLCALIKVSTPLKGLSFDVGALGITKTEQHKEEVWVFVPEGVKRINISHQQYGVLRDYDLGQTLKRGRTYYLLLDYKLPTTNSFGSIDLSSNPSMADIYIDDKLMGKTPNLIPELETGLHQYRIVIPDYVEISGELEIQKDKTQKLFADLNKAQAPVISVDDVTFRMIFVEGGTFMMGATKEQLTPEDVEKPVHKVTLSSYYIGETEVPQQLWEAIMESNPSSPKGPYRPVSEVSWNDCQLFIEKLNQKTGLTFRLPTEAEWEFAARGGKKSQGYQYSGDNDLSTVGWYRDNSGNLGSPTGHYNDVKSLTPNELNLFDMSGGVWEWCQDKMGAYSAADQNNPIGMTTGNERVIRGGSWKSSMWGCRVAVRNSELPDSHNDCIGVRLALQSFPENYFVNDKGEMGQQMEAMDIVENNEVEEFGQEDKLHESSVDTICFKVGKVSFSMVHIDGGAFRVWDGEDFGSEDITYIMNKLYENNFDVVLPSYYIGETEVTQELWHAVMGSNPVKNDIWINKKRPVDNVSRNDCLDFIKNLNKITGKVFRLPTDAEWQYAAQGGKKRKYYKYSWNNLDKVTWSSPIKMNVVKMQQPNELGIYDIGNMWEWCNDSFNHDNKQYYIIRGLLISKTDDCNFQFRGSELPKQRTHGLGFRLALSK